MADIPSDIKTLIKLFITHKVRFAVCGGHAVAHHGYPRMTMDVDLLIEPTKENAKRVMAALEQFGFGNAGIPEEAFTKEKTAITLGQQPNQIDLLTSMSSVPTSEIIKRSDSGKLAEIELKFVSRSDLMEAKRQAGRPKDLAALDELEKSAQKQ
jgi:hypothetical protein